MTSGRWEPDRDSGPPSGGLRGESQAGKASTALSSKLLISSEQLHWANIFLHRSLRALHIDLSSTGRTSIESPAASSSNLGSEVGRVEEHTSPLASLA